MAALTDSTKKKKKDLYKVMEAIEQYDFFFRQLCFAALFKDQSKIKKPKLKSIIEL
jgi:hypothetical protein|tara:strand:+ start:282 stop:449 length:168 start_codon:yes stop_codon:yes gene_type:complete